MKPKMISCIGGGEISQTIDASYYKGPGARNGKEREIVAEEPIMMSDRKGHSGISEDGIGTTLTAQEKERPLIGQSIVRRLTPKECERLQGYLDDWTKLPEKAEMDDSEYEFWKDMLFQEGVREQRIRLSDSGDWEIWKPRIIRAAKDDEEDDEITWVNTHKPYKHKTKDQMISWYNKSFVYDTDSARYKALGNSIAVGYANRQSGFWCWLARRICAQYERQITLGSLFDGIGGFPLAFEAAGANPVWASEIEKFPIAVTRHHFPEEAKDGAV